MNLSVNNRSKKERKKKGERYLSAGGGGIWGGEMLKALAEMSSAYCRVEINSFITLCSYHYHHHMACLQ